MSVPRPSLLLTALAVACVAAACDRSDPVRGHLGGGSAQLGADGYGRDWAGVFLGAGRGIVGTRNVDVPDARMVIELDPDSVRVDGCASCVTITLDTLFWRPNVHLTHPQSVVVRYVDDGVRHALALDLFSGAGGTANVVQAALRLEEVDGSRLLADMTYVLER